VGKAVSF